jgi:hypothetical protein
MRFCWRKNWEPIRSSLTRFAGGGRRSGGTFLLPALWACLRPGPSYSCWISGAQWTACVRPVSTFRRKSLTSSLRGNRMRPIEYFVQGCARMDHWWGRHSACRDFSAPC